MPTPPAAHEATRLAVLRRRLVAPMPDDRPWGWLGPLLVTAFGAWLAAKVIPYPGWLSHMWYRIGHGWI